MSCEMLPARGDRRSFVTDAGIDFCLRALSCEGHNASLAVTRIVSGDTNESIVAPELLPVHIDLTHENSSGFWPFDSEYWEASDIDFIEPNTGLELHHAKYYPQGDKVDLTLSYGMQIEARHGGRACS